VLVLFALLLPVLLGLGSIVMSVGNWYVHKRHLQTQVDAAVLASGTDFIGCFLNPGTANGLVKTAALNYAGDTQRDGTTSNLQVQEPNDVRVVLNSSTYWSSGTPGTDPVTGYGLDWTMDGDPSTPTQDSSQPCDARFLDAKATDHELPLLWRWLPLFPSTKAHAVVEIKKQPAMDGFLPLAVPENNPRSVFALFVDESEGNTVDGWKELDPPLDPNDTSTVNGEEVAVWDGLAEIDVTDETGVIILRSRQDLTDADLQGKSLAAMCSMVGTTCFGNIRNQSPPTTNDTGLSFIFGQGGTPPPNGATISDAQLTNFDTPGNDFGPANPSCATTDDTSPYFMWTADCQVRIRATIEFGANVPASPRIVRAQLNGPFGANCNGGQTLDLRDGWWESPWFTIPAGSGRNNFYLCWHAGTGNTFEDNFGQRVIQMAFAANTDPQLSNTVFSGPIVYTSVQPGHSYPKAPQTVFVSVGMIPPLRISDGNAKPVMLRLAGQGSLNQALDCDHSPIQLPEEIRDGCLTPYQTNVRSLSCSPNPTWDTNNLPPPLPQPGVPNPLPDCIEANPGDVTSLAKGLHEKWEDPAPPKVPCPPNLWKQYRSTGDVPTVADPRYIVLVIAEYGTFNAQGIDVVPISKFAGFYATGWFVGGGAQGTQGCPDNDPPPPCPDPANPSGSICDPANSRYQGGVWGYFITPVFPSPNQPPSEDLCDFSQLGTCAAVLTK
jgi:hypothetical protein